LKNTFAPKTRYPHLCPSTTGAIGELRVSTDLLEKGFDVFRSLSPSASCDLAIIKDGAFKRVEVRTSYFSRDGSIHCDRTGNYDLLAMVLPNQIVYDPPLPPLNGVS
jgi:hypothetical protein